MRILVLARYRDSYPNNPNVDAFKMSKKKPKPNNQLVKFLT